MGHQPLPARCRSTFGVSGRMPSHQRAAARQASAKSPVFLKVGFRDLGQEPLPCRFEGGARRMEAHGGPARAHAVETDRPAQLVGIGRNALV